MSTTRRVAQALTTTALAAAVSLGFAAPAQAAVTGMSLSFGAVDEGTGYFWIPVDGVVKMPEAEARGSIVAGYQVRLKLIGEDPVSDDQRFTYPGSASLWAAADGLHFTQSARVRASVLNEDDSWTDRTDELHVHADFVYAPANRVERSANSNKIVGRF